MSFTRNSPDKFYYAAFQLYLHPIPDEDCEIELQMSLNEPHYWLDFCDYVERGNASGEIGESNGRFNLIRVAAGWTQNLTWRRT